jgi:3-oxoacyl-[acyl-carrier protein] reductase
MKLAGKTALITGAGSGIGRATALLFAEEGANIAVNDINLSTAEETSSTIKLEGHRAIAIKADVAETVEVDAMIDRVIEEFGGIHILVNNAGMASGCPTIDFSLESLVKIISVNLTGPFLCCQKAGRWMIRNGGGRIINIASVAGMKGVEGGAAYSSSKAGVINLTRSLAIEWAKYNINVNVIAPGFINTPMQLDVNEVGEEVIEEMRRSIPQKRFGEAEEVAKVALFLASNDVSYVTGVTIPVDGGYTS